MAENKELYWKSAAFGAGIGSAFGALIGTITGALSASWNGILYSAIAGALLGLVAGALTGALVVRTAGRAGGVSIGAYSGMVLGGLLGGVAGIFIPASFRASVAARDILILKVLTQGRFETAVLLGFLVCIVCTIVGAWVSGRNLIRKNTAS